MTQTGTGRADVTADLLAIQSSTLEAVQHYRRYLRNAENAGLTEVAYFIHLLMEEDLSRATHCQGLLRKLGKTKALRPLAGKPGQPRTQPATRHTSARARNRPSVCGNIKTEMPRRRAWASCGVVAPRHQQHAVT